MNLSSHFSSTAIKLFYSSPATPSGVHRDQGEKIKNFIIDDLGFDPYSVIKLRRTSNSITVTQDKEKAVTILRISNINVINNYLVPYLSAHSSAFLTKKSEDFEDFKLISSAVHRGSHKIKEIKELILKMTYTMNNYRLTTNKKEIKAAEALTSEERRIIQNASPTLERLKDGRIRDIETGKIETKSSQCLYEVIKQPLTSAEPSMREVSTGSIVGYDPEVLIFDTLKDTSQTLGLDVRKLKRCVDEAMGD